MERAVRFQLNLPLRYRRPGETRWRQARSKNVSRSGVLFWTDTPLSPGVDLEICLALTTAKRAAPRAEVLCSAQVVRCEDAPPHGPPMVAATFREYRFMPPRMA